MSLHDPNEAAEAISDHVYAVGEACLREHRAPTSAEAKQLAALEREYDRVTAKAERMAAQIAPIIDQINTENHRRGEQYRRMLEGRGF